MRTASNLAVYSMSAFAQLSKSIPRCCHVLCSHVSQQHGSRPTAAFPLVPRCSEAPQREGDRANKDKLCWKQAPGEKLAYANVVCYLRQDNRINRKNTCIRAEEPAPNRQGNQVEIPACEGFPPPYQLLNVPPMDETSQEGRGDAW